MNIQLCGSLINVDTLFKCIGNKTNDADKRNVFSLVIDKRIKDYTFDIKFNDSRVSMLDYQLRYLNMPNLCTSLPAIFITKNVRGKLMVDVIHPDVASFYKNLISSCIQERSVVKLHIIMNRVHILLTTYPIFDNKNKIIIGCTLMETPFSEVSNKNEIRVASEINTLSTF